jgi:hypothetical protein
MSPIKRKGSKMPRRLLEEWERDMARAVDDRLMRDLVSDAQAHKTIISNGTAAKNDKVTPVGAGVAVDAGPGAKHRGWVEAPKLKQPEGVKLIDEIAEAFDKVDRRKGLLG